MGARENSGNKLGERHTVAAAYLKSFYKSAIEFGVRKELLPDIPNGGIKGLDHKNRRYPAQLLLDVIGASKKQMDDPALGLRFGLNLRPERNIDVIYALAFCHDLKEVIEFNIAYQPLIQEIGRTRLELTEKHAKCVWTPHIDGLENLPEFVEAIFAGYASIGRWLLWTTDPPIEGMRFRHSRSSDTHLYNVTFGDKVEFNANVDEIIFRREALDALMPSRNPNMIKRLRPQLDQLLAELETSNHLVADIKVHIKDRLNLGSVSINDLCDNFNISERTLRRRLISENTSFRELVMICRRELIEIYLTDESMSFAQIAQALGFNDQSSFSRAFKQWYGVSPRSYKREYQTP